MPRHSRHIEDSDSSSDEERYRRKSYSSHHRRKHRSSSSKRYRSRSPSPHEKYRGSHSRGKYDHGRSSTHSHREDKNLKPKEICSSSSSDIPHAVEAAPKVEGTEETQSVAGKAKEKMSVLAKLGIQLNLPQQEKKLKLWTNDKSSGGCEAWKTASFGDGKVTAKFQRLMGIKDATAVGAPSTSNPKLNDQEKLFQTMEAQYEVARQTTHTLRGAGLGFPK